MLKTGILLSDFGYGRTVTEQIRAVKDAGFDTFFTHVRPADETELLCNEAAKAGLTYESVHGPFMHIDRIWQENGEYWVDELKSVVDHARRFGIGIINMHCMYNPPGCHPFLHDNLYSDMGAERFRRVTEYAGERGIIMAYENVEFPSCELAGLMEKLRGLPNLGFTWDTGHELVYKDGNIELMAEFGDLLVGTHINDNCGRRNPDHLSPEDDIHIPPYSGKVDFDRVARLLKQVNYRGSVTLEIKQSKLYPESLPDLETYLADAHERAVRIARQIEA